MFINHIYIYNIYMYKPDWALNNLQWLIYHKTKQNKTNQSEKITTMWGAFASIYYSSVHDVGIYKLYLKTIETKAVFTKIEKSNEWNIHFLQNNSQGKFSIVQNTSESSLFYMMCSCTVLFLLLSFMSLYVQFRK